MIIDGPTGIELIPGNGGKDCPGNGENGNECCCDECNYLGCCIEHFRKKPCNECVHIECPRNENYGLRLERIRALEEQIKNDTI
ncbi:MAG: hypothetical protein J6A61_09235 [Clostridia bacterium]|nr:hypothetical protein [Clostridia bacterium]